MSDYEQHSGKLKLVEEYPGSPEKGSIVYSGHKSQPYQDYKYKLKNTRNTSNYIFFDAEYVENFPKNWRKIKPKK